MLFWTADMCETLSTHLFILADAFIQSDLQLLYTVCQRSHASGATRGQVSCFFVKRYQQSMNNYSLINEESGISTTNLFVLQRVLFCSVLDLSCSHWSRIWHQQII